MIRYLCGLIGLALLAAQPLPAGETACGGGAACNAGSECCPHCGCRLVPVCHITCTTKKVTEYKYSCVCETICVPGVTPLCKKCEGCDSCCDNGCQEGCAGRCLVRDVKKLVKHPVTKEVPVRTCTVQWVCPNCPCDGNGPQGAAPPATQPTAPPAPLPPAPQAEGKTAAND